MVEIYIINTLMSLLVANIDEIFHITHRRIKISSKFIKERYDNIYSKVIIFTKKCTAYCLSPKWIDMDAL